MSRKVLVTGAAGFLGHHVVDLFLQKTDWHIFALDGLVHTGDLRRLEEIGADHNDRCMPVICDLVHPIPTALAKYMGDVDIIVNLASESHVDRSIESPVGFVRNNVDLMLTMLEYARVAKPHMFIQVSTDEVYGPAPEGIYHWEGDPHRPSNPYAASKAAQENLAYAWWRTYGVPVVTVNSMNLFGERQHPEKFIPKAIKLLSQGQPVPIHASKLSSHGESASWQSGSRSWLHAKNFADALRFIIETLPVSHYVSEDDQPHKLHVGGDERSNYEIARQVANVMGVYPDFYYQDFHTARPGHDRRYALNDVLIRQMGWKPILPFEQALTQTVEWTVKNKDSWL